jgi:hypothetical protein
MVDVGRHNKPAEGHQVSQGIPGLPVYMTSRLLRPAAAAREWEHGSQPATRHLSPHMM